MDFVVDPLSATPRTSTSGSANVCTPSVVAPVPSCPSTGVPTGRDEGTGRQFRRTRFLDGTTTCIRCTSDGTCVLGCLLPDRKGTDTESLSLLVLSGDRSGLRTGSFPSGSFGGIPAESEVPRRPTVPSTGTTTSSLETTSSGPSPKRPLVHG